MIVLKKFSFMTEPLIIYSYKRKIIMSQLIRLKDIQATHRDLIGDDYYDPTGKVAYGVNEEKIGKIEGALVEDTTGRIRYLIVDAGGWFSSKEVLVPAGLWTSTITTISIVIKSNMKKIVNHSLLTAYQQKSVWKLLSITTKRQIR